MFDGIHSATKLSPRRRRQRPPPPRRHRRLPHLPPPVATCSTLPRPPSSAPPSKPRPITTCGITRIHTPFTPALAPPPPTSHSSKSFLPSRKSSVQNSFGKNMKQRNTSALAAAIHCTTRIILSNGRRRHLQRPHPRRRRRPLPAAAAISRLNLAGQIVRGAPLPRTRRTANLHTAPIRPARRLRRPPAPPRRPPSRPRLRTRPRRPRPSPFWRHRRNPSPRPHPRPLPPPNRNNLHPPPPLLYPLFHPRRRRHPTRPRHRPSPGRLELITQRSEKPQP